MPSDTKVLAVFAHPDDEFFLCAGTFAQFVDAGVEVVLVSATRGEEGEIADVVDATRETLGEVRERELRLAMKEIGVEDVRFLGYRDSGMDGTPENEHPESLAQADAEVVGAQIRSIVDEVRPTILIAFGPEGLYLHPDHIAVHRASMASVAMAAADSSAHRPEILVFVTMPRAPFLEVWSQPGNMFEDIPYEKVIQMGTPEEEITHTVDVEPFIDRKMAALRQHRSQIGDDEPLSQFDPEFAQILLRYERFRQQHLPWNTREERSFPLGRAHLAGSTGPLIP